MQPRMATALSFLPQTLIQQWLLQGWAVNGPVTPSLSIFISMFNPEVSLEPCSPHLVPAPPHAPGGGGGGRAGRDYWGHEVLPTLYFQHRK